MTKHPHPITPPPELAEEWRLDYIDRAHAFIDVAAKIARWAADQELEACCEWLTKYRKPILGNDLRYVRRPNPPSLKEQALKALHASVGLDEFPEQYDTIRRALEQLPDAL